MTHASHLSMQHWLLLDEILQAADNIEPPLVNRAQLRGQLHRMNATPEQCETLTASILAMPETERTDFGLMVRAGMPLSLLVEYISAPSYPANGEISRETIFARETSRPEDRVDMSLGEIGMRASYMGALAIFGASLPLVGVRLAAFTPLASEVKEFAGAVDLATAGIVHLIGMSGLIEADALQAMGGLAPLALATFAMGMARKSWKERQLKRHDHVSTKAAQVSNGVAEDIYGFSKNEALIKKRLAAMSKGDKHLLRHLDPHEIRVFLSGDEQQAREVLEHRKVSFNQKVDAVAADSSYFSFLANMMGISLPQWALTRLAQATGSIDDPNKLLVGSEDRLIGKLFARRAEHQGAGAKAEHEVKPQLRNMGTQTP